MRKILLIVVFAILLIACGCTVIKSDNEKKKDVDYTITYYNQVPDEVKKIIDEKKAEKFSAVFSDPENTYILIGFGRKESDGYSISLDEIYESDTDIFVKTTFKGPEEVAKIKEETYPYIIIKIEYTEKSVNVL